MVMLQHDKAQVMMMMRKMRHHTHHRGSVRGSLSLPGVVSDGGESLSSLLTFRQRLLRLLQEPAGDEERKARCGDDANDADDVNGGVGGPRGVLQVLQVF